VTVAGFDVQDSFDEGGIAIQGVGQRASRVYTTGAFTGITFGGGSRMMCHLRGFEMVGPGQHVIGSRATAWMTTAGSYNWSDLYIHDFDIGESWYDSTLGTQTNINIRLCNRGLSLGWQTDIFNFIGGRIDYNDVGIYFGDEGGFGAGGSSSENCLSFIGSRISNNNTAYVVNDFGANGIDFHNCYFEGNAKEAVIGSPGRGDVIGPSVSYRGAHWEQYSVMLLRGVRQLLHRRPQHRQ